MSCYDAWRTFHEVCFKILLYLRGFKSRFKLFQGNRGTDVVSVRLPPDPSFKWYECCAFNVKGQSAIIKLSGQRGCPAVLRPGCHIVSFGKHNLCNRCPDMILFMEKFICVLQMVLPSYIKMTFWQVCAVLSPVSTYHADFICTSVEWIHWHSVCECQMWWDFIL